MDKSIVRIKKITIDHFRNVKHGSVQMNCNGNRKGDLLGIFGQNGSGKTAMIKAISLLQYAITHTKLKKDFVDYINFANDHSSFTFDFDIVNAHTCYEVTYSFSLKAMDDEIRSTHEIIPVLYNESLSFSYQSENEKIRKTKIMDTNTTDPFGPKSKYQLLIGDDEKRMDLLVKKGISFRSSQSFVFSHALYKAIENSKNRDDLIVKKVKYILSRLYDYGEKELFVIDGPFTRALFIDYKNVSRKIFLNLNGPTEISDEMLVSVNDTIKNMNTILPHLIPGLTIGLKEIGSQLSKRGDIQRCIELMSYKNEKEIPLRYEGEGIKKIIAILQLLMILYNHSSMTLVIDDLDCNIFEYLLGELLRIISEQGMGQLIFTAHNLRPLEVLNKKDIVFTTTNASQRYIRLNNIKSTVNLRNYYDRDLIVDEQKESLYDYTHTFDLSIALKAIKRNELFKDDSLSENRLT